MTDFVEVAQTFLGKGFSVIPTGANKRCTLKEWGPYQDRLMTTDEAKLHFATADRLAAIGGKISGNLECLDFDDPSTYAPFIELLTGQDPALVGVLVKRKTPRGGFHLYYRCTEPVAGNLKLASDQAGAVRIETRGEGGYFLTSPSPGYEKIEHSILDTPTITPAQVEMIHTLARMFDQRPQRAEQAPNADKNNTGSPGNDYNTRHTVADTLALYGWKEDRRTTAGKGWTRPGKDNGTSGVLLYSTGNFYCWSSNAFPLEAGKSYGSFAIYAAYEHNGDYQAAARTLAGKGYGTPPAQTATTTPTDAETIQRLAALSPIEYDRIRAQEAERLKIKVGTLDKEVAGARKGKAEINVEPLDVEAWGQEINPGQLLSDIVVTVKRFIVCADETAIAVALWVAFTWFIEVVQIAPLAIITAPDKRCGKSILLFLLGKLVKRPLAASNISGPALFRTIDAWNPTLLVDEADAFMKENEELRGLFNCGHTRDSAFTIRLVGDNHEPKQFNVWGAKALAGIGKLADTMMDRAIVLNLRRKLPHETVDRLRYAEPNLFEELSQKLARFADDYSEEIRRARPDLPAALNDRAQDNWEPLLAIAEVAGGEWPKKAKDAALKMTGVQGDSRSIGVELLADIQTVFEAKKVDKISTVNLIAALCEDEEGPWATWNKGKQITPRQVSFRLSDYGISSKGIRIGPDTPKGFDKEQFTEAFSRYLSIIPLSSATPPQTNDSKGFGVADNPPRCVNNMQKATGNQPESLTCCAVADFSGGPEHTQGLEVFDL